MKFRDLRDEDRPYVMKSMLKTCKSCASLKSMESRSYYRLYHKVVENMLNDAKVMVVSDPESDWLILGFGIYDDSDPDLVIVHYIHVRGTHRGIGLFTDMLKRMGVTDNTQCFAYTFDTKDAVRMSNKGLFPAAIFRHELAIEFSL